MHAVNLGAGQFMRDLADLRKFLRNFNGPPYAHSSLTLIEQLDLELFKKIVDLYCDLAELDFDSVPTYVGFENQVVFVDTLIWMSFPEPNYRIANLVKTLTKLRAKSWSKDHQLVCEPVLRIHYPKLLAELGLK